MKEASDEFVERFRQYRRMSKVSAQDIADLLDCARETVFKWTSGQRLISKKDLHRICQHMGLDPEQTAELIALAYPELERTESTIPALFSIPPPVTDFVGRDDEVRGLIQALRAVKTEAGVILGLKGLGGIGKTQLAYKVVQQVAPLFPDGRILLELRGATAEPMDAAEALRRVIRAFDPRAKLSSDQDALKQQYRSILAGKRVLILADDARDTLHIADLRPPAGCALLITSRTEMSLAGTENYELGLLDTYYEDLAVAEVFLLSICPFLGSYAGELASICGYLPLAMRISASFLATNGYPVDQYVRQLAAKRLALLQDRDNPNDPRASVMASLLLSYTSQPEAVQVALSMLSVFVGSFDAQAAQSVLELLKDSDSQRVLQLLWKRSLIMGDVRAKRYWLHDLVREFATERLTDSKAVRLEHARHYLQVTEQVRDLFRAGGDTALGALRLFDQERTQIDAAWQWARLTKGIPNTDVLIVRFADATSSVGYLRYDKRLERIPHLQDGVEAAQRLGERKLEGKFLGNLGLAYFELGDTALAIDYLQSQLSLVREIDDRIGEGKALSNLAAAYYVLKDWQHSDACYRQRLAIAREVGDRIGEASALGGLGNVYVALGDLQQGLSYCEQWLALAQTIGDRRGEGLAYDGIGGAHEALGDLKAAQECYERGLVCSREIGDQHGAAMTSWHLGKLYARQSKIEQAISSMQVYVDYLHEIEHPEADIHAQEVAQLRQQNER